MSATSRGLGGSTSRPRWIAAKPRFFLPVRVISKLFRRLMLENLAAAHAARKLQFFGAHAHLASTEAFTTFLAPLRKMHQSSRRSTQLTIWNIPPEKQTRLLSCLQRNPLSIGFGFRRDPAAHATAETQPRPLANWDCGRSVRPA